jgi:hypothetical protein
MAITKDATSGGSVANASSVSWTHTITSSQSNLILLVAVYLGSSRTISTITYAGTNMTQLATKSQGTFNAYLYYILAPATGANSVSITTSGSGQIDAAAISYYNVAQSSTFGTAATASGTTTSASNTVSTSNTNQLVIDVDYVFAASASESATASQTVEITQAQSTTMKVGIADIAATGSNMTLTWTEGSSSITWCQISVAMSSAGTVVDHDTLYRGVISKTADKDTLYRGVLSKTSDKDTLYRGNLAKGIGTKDTLYRGVLSKTADKDTLYRAFISKTADKDTLYRGNVGKQTDKDTLYRGVLSKTGTHDTLFRGNIAPPISIVSLNNYKQQVVQVFNAAGQFLDVWRDAPILSGFKEAINAATTPLRVILPRKFDNYDLAGDPNSRGTIAQGNVVKYYIFGPGLPALGLLRYQGIIDAFQPKIDANGAESIEVTITPQSSIIEDHGIVTNQAFGQAGIASTYVDPVSMFNWFFNNNDYLTGKTYANPLTLDGTNPASSGVTTQYTFAAQTLHSIFDTIILMLPANWFYRFNPNLSVTLNQTPVAAQHTFVIGQHIAEPTYKQDWSLLKNTIVYKGSGNLAARRFGSDIATFGERLQLTVDTRVTDQNTLNTLAQGLLTNLDQMLLRTTIKLIDYRGDSRTQMGYDIEAIKVGDSCTILDPSYAPTSSHAVAVWDTAKWDVDYWTFIPGIILNQVAVITSLSYNWDYVTCELASFQPNQDLALNELRRSFADYTMAR